MPTSADWRKYYEDMERMNNECKLPLRLDAEFPGRIRNADGKHVAEATMRYAGLIVRAVNAHDDLLEALKAFMLWHSQPFPGDDKEVKAIAHAAIAKATGDGA